MQEARIKQPTVAVDERHENGLKPVRAAYDEKSNGAVVDVKDLNARLSSYGKLENETDEKDVQQLIDQGADVNAKSEYGEPLLNYAARHWDTRMVNLLIRNGVNLDAQGLGGRTALMEAIDGGNEKLANLLIVKGADVNAKDDKGMTALLHITEGYNKWEDTGWRYNGSWDEQHVEVAEKLIAKGADTNARDNNGRPALVYVMGHLYRYIDACLPGLGHCLEIGEAVTALSGHRRIVKLLIANGADVNVKDNDGWTALKLAKDIQKSLISNPCHWEGAGRVTESPMLSTSIIFKEASKLVAELKVK